MIHQYAKRWVEESPIMAVAVLSMVYYLISMSIDSLQVRVFLLLLLVVSAFSIGKMSKLNTNETEEDQK